MGSLPQLDHLRDLALVIVIAGTPLIVPLIAYLVEVIGVRFKHAPATNRNS